MRRLLFSLPLVCIAACERPAAPDTHVPGEENACTEEVKICADGTPVGRVGPHCAFADCPGARDGASIDFDGTPSDGQSSPPVPTEDSEKGG